MPNILTWELILQQTTWFGMLFLWKLVWCLKVPPRVAIVACYCPREDFVYRYCMEERYYCCRLVRCLFGLPWVMPQRVLNLLATWQGSFGRRQNIAFWRVVLHCIMCFWTLNPFSFILC